MCLKPKRANFSNLVQEKHFQIRGWMEEVGNVFFSGKPSISGKR